MSIENILQRMREAIGVETDAQLASYLGTSSSVVSNWKARERRPLSECEQISMDMGVSMDWLLTGEGPKLRGTQVQPELPLKVRKLLELVLDMDEERQEQVLRRAEDQKRAAEERREMMELREELLRLKANQRSA